jgi:tetratricopeptide (TPR) repeat protein
VAEQAIALLSRLSKEYPANAEYRRELADAHNRLAEHRRTIGKYRDAVAERNKELRLRQRLAADHPEQPEYRRRVAITHIDVANVVLYVNSKAAEPHYREALAILDKLSRDFPNISKDYYGLSHARHWLGTWLSNAGRFAEAEKELRLAYALRAECLGKHPNDLGMRGDFAHGHYHLGKVLIRTGKFEEAEKVLRTGIELHEKLRDEYPKVVEYLRRQSDQHGEFAHLLVTQRRKDAEKEARRAIDLKGQLVRISGDQDAKKNLAWSRYNLAVVLHDAGRLDEAAEEFRESFALFEKLAADHPDIPIRLNYLAWNLATCPAPQFRDGARAVVLAKKALQLEPFSGKHWGCLAAAHLEAGQWRSAVEAAEKSMELLGREDGGAGLILAMAHQHLGNKKEARQWYDRADKRIQTIAASEPVLHYWHNEAAYLLGVKERPRPPEKR